MIRTQSGNGAKKAAFTEISFGGKVPPRCDIPVEYTWDLSALQPSDEAWEESFRRAGEEMQQLASYNGKLFDSPETLLEFLRLEEKASERMGKLYAYATMKSHENTSEALYQGMADRAGMLYSSFAAVCSTSVGESETTISTRALPPPASFKSAPNSEETAAHDDNANKNNFLIIFPF